MNEQELRDHFAGLALQGWFASPDSNSVLPEGRTAAGVRYEMCRLFYTWADAMLAARRQP